MKAICKKQYPQMKEILNVGDVVEIETIYSTREEVICSGMVYITDDRGYVQKITVDKNSRIVNPIGSYKGYRFKSKNGNTYSDNEVYNMIGRKTLSEIFNKVE